MLRSAEFRDLITDAFHWLDQQKLIVSPNPDRDPVARPGDDMRTHQELAQDFLASRQEEGPCPTK